MSEFALFLSVISSYFYRITEKNRFYIGIPVLNRSTVIDKNTVGAFINTIPISIQIEDKDLFSDLYTRIGCSLLKSYRHYHFSYSDILKTLRAERGFEDGLFDVIVSYQNIKVSGNLSSTWHHCGAQIESLQIHISDRDDNGFYTLDYDYQVEKYTESEIVRMHENIFNLLADAIENKDKEVSNLNILSNDEYQRIIYDFNDNYADYPRERCIHTLFEEQALEVPDKIAVIACDRTLTYKQLNEEANQIANMLVAEGVKGGDIVGILLPRKAILMSSLLGILKAGAAYMPLETTYTDERIIHVMESSKVRHLVTISNINRFENCDIHLVEDDLMNFDKTDTSLQADSESLFCLLHTSGSTGIPKAIAITHRNVGNFYHVTNYMFNACSYSAAITSVSFDAFIQDSLLPILHQITCVLFNEEECGNQSIFESVIKKYDDLFIFCTPTRLLSYIKNSPQKSFLNNINTIVVGGEIFGVELYALLCRYYFPEKTSTPTPLLYTGYGPAEATIGVTYYRVMSEDITIGRPISNAQIYILDKYLNPVPIGISGELCIAGEGVGKGYLNSPELTAEKFILNPFSEGRMYKTGDLAKWRMEGDIEFLGRNDFQVKLRGLRIELGEIEGAISEFDGIYLVAVTKETDAIRGQYLVGYYVCDQVIDEKALRRQITAKLPKYMVPNYFMCLEKMPLTASGKIDRKNLPTLDLSVNQVEYIAPTNEIERLLCSIMAEVLDIPRVGTSDDFFYLGGDSLKAIEFVSKAHGKQVYFSLQNIFDYPTVATLCSFINVDNEECVNFAVDDFKDVHRMISCNCDDIGEPQKVAMGNLLITGVTGFLGMHLLSQYIEAESGIVYCLVRGENLEEATQRFVDSLKYYFDEKYLNLLGSRIVVIHGDIEQDNLGISQEINQKITIDTVIHGAASVKHFGSYESFYDINVKGTLNAINYTKSAKAKFIHISTLSISGNSLAEYRSKEEKHFSEQDLFIGQQLDNVYIRSKFEAEKIVLDEMAKGLSANIIRVGNLTNRATDFKFQQNYKSNAFLARIKAIFEIKLFPDYLMPLYCEFSPIDDTAMAIIKIVQHFNRGKTIFHLNSHKKVYFDKMFEHTSTLGINIDVIDGRDFAKKLADMANYEETKKIYEALINDMDDKGNLLFDTNVSIENSSTVKYLSDIGFEWSDIDFSYIKGYINYFKNIGFF